MNSKQFLALAMAIQSGAALAIEPPGYTVSNVNLPIGSASITALAVSPNNALWVGTPSGLHQRVGEEWHTFTPVNCAINSATVTAVACDGNRVWVGTRVGVNVYEAGNWRTFDPRPPLSNHVYAIAIAGGRICISTGKGIAIRENNRWRTISDDAEYPKAVTIGSDGLIHAGHRFGIDTWKDEEWRGRSYDYFKLPSHATRLAVQGDTVWRGGYDLSFVRGSSWTRCNEDHCLLDVTAIAPAKDNCVWVGGRGEVALYDQAAKRWDAVRLPKTLLKSPVTALAVTDDGVWIGTEKGLVFAERRPSP